MIESGFLMFSWFQWEIKRTYQWVWLQNHRLHNIMQIYTIAVWNQIQFIFLIFYRYYKSIFESHTICRRFPRYLSLWHSTLDLKDLALSSGVAFNRWIGIYRRLSLIFCCMQNSSITVVWSDSDIHCYCPYISYCIWWNV